MTKFHRQTAALIAAMAFIMACFIFLAWVASGLLIRPAAAETTQHLKENFCQSLSQLHEEMDKKVGDIPHVSRIMRGLPAKRFVKAFNEFGDKTSIDADSVGFYVVATQPEFIIVSFEKNHCVKEKGLMPVGTYVELMRISENVSNPA